MRLHFLLLLAAATLAESAAQGNGFEIETFYSGYSGACCTAMHVIKDGWGRNSIRQAAVFTFPTIDKLADDDA